MAADHESQTCRKERKSIQSLEYLWCQEGQHQGSASTAPLEREGGGSALQRSPVSRTFPTKSKELTHRMENLCPPWEKSVSCEIYQLIEPFSLENKPFSPCWGHAQGDGLCFDDTRACLGLFFPPPSALPSSPFSSWLINNWAVQNSQNLPRPSYKRRYSPLEKPA